MVLFKSFFKFIINPLALILAVCLFVYLSFILIWRGVAVFGEFCFCAVLRLEIILGESWLGKRFGRIIDAGASIFE